jgi:hypothetical protein
MFGSGTVFWADALCINQSDVNERNRQVEIMRSIYARGQYVLIWRGEDRRTRDALKILKSFGRHLVRNGEPLSTSWLWQTIISMSYSGFKSRVWMGCEVLRAGFRP